MDEDALAKLSINDLFDLMIKSSNKILAIDCREENELYEIKKKELQLIQHVIVARRAEFKPVDLP